MKKCISCVLGLFEFSSLHTLIEGLGSRSEYYKTSFNVCLYITTFCLSHSQECKHEETPNYGIISEHKKKTLEFTVAFYLESLKASQALTLPVEIHDNPLRMVSHVGYSSVSLRETNQQKLAENYLRTNLSARLES